MSTYERYSFKCSSPLSLVATTYYVSCQCMNYRFPTPAHLVHFDQ